MTLSFSEELNQKPSLFLQKIHNGLSLPIEHQEIYMKAYYSKFGKYWDECGDLTLKPKLHTIRQDASNLWKAGNSIHPVIRNRRPDRLQFAPEFPCVSTQYFQILYEDGYPIVYIGDTKEDWMPFFFHNEEDGSIMYGEDDMLKLAQNDGFESIKDFFEYFSENFEGKLIHFSELKY